jgi:hypothetical protein
MVRTAAVVICLLLSAPAFCQQPPQQKPPSDEELEKALKARISAKSAEAQNLLVRVGVRGVRGGASINLGGGTLDEVATKTKNQFKPRGTAVLQVIDDAFEAIRAANVAERQLVELYLRQDRQRPAVQHLQELAKRGDTWAMALLLKMEFDAIVADLNNAKGSHKAAMQHLQEMHLRGYGPATELWRKLNP